MITELNGIRNGHIVDTKLLRGGDVSTEGIELLAAMGVRRVICFKTFTSSSHEEIWAEKRYVEASGMQFTHAPLNGSGVFGYGDGAKIPAILKLIAETKGKVFVNCHKGSDRTGVVVACYRITEGWTADRAIAEMRRFGNRWIHFGMRAFVREFAKGAT